MELFAALERRKAQARSKRKRKRKHAWVADVHTPTYTRSHKPPPVSAVIPAINVRLGACISAIY